MKPKGLSLKTKIGLGAWYFGRTALLVLPIALMQAGVIVALIFLVRSDLLRVGKTILFLIILWFGESFVYGIWFVLQEKFMDYQAFRRKVASETKNPRLHKKLLANDMDEEVRLAAIGQVRDSSWLNDIALTDDSLRMRIAAAERLSEPDEAEALLRASDNPRVKQTALSYIRDQATLREYALHDPNSCVRAAAAEKIDSPELLLKIMDGTQDKGVWRICLPKLIRNSRVEGVIPESLWTAIRNAVHAEALLDMRVCPDCGAEVCHFEENRGVDIDNISEYDDDPTLVVFCKFYRCEGCGREEEDYYYLEAHNPGFSVPLGTLLTRE